MSHPHRLLGRRGPVVGWGPHPYRTRRGWGIRLLPGYRTDVTGLTRNEARALFVLTTGSAQKDLGLGTAARSALLNVMRAVPEPFRPAAAATSQRILVDPRAGCSPRRRSGSWACCRRRCSPVGGCGCGTAAAAGRDRPGGDRARDR